jgi:2,4-dienoyl-CoA reductase (NADPH2)
MHTGLEDGRKHFPAMAAFYAERARGGVGLIVTGGFAPNIEGWSKPFAGTLATHAAARRHREVTDAVHAEGGASRCRSCTPAATRYHPLAVAPSRIQSPISPFTPRELSERGIERQIRAFVRCARAGARGRLRRRGSDGQRGLLDQPVPGHAHQPAHRPLGRRLRQPHAPGGGRGAPRARGGGAGLHPHLPPEPDRPDPGGSSWAEVLQLAQAVAAAGATIINTGIGWHEARVPTIATSVPRAAFAWRDAAPARRPARAGRCRAGGHQQPHQHARGGRAGAGRGRRRHGVLARPFLADADFVAKAAAGRADEINTCIACNQACLDHAFQNRLASCLVNPRAGHETTLVIRPASARRRFAVVGAGPAGLAAATTLAERGHAVDLFDAAADIGGQFNLARRIPGKEEFAETLRYFRRRIERTGVALHLGRAPRPPRWPRPATTPCCWPPASPRATRASRARTRRACSATSSAIRDPARVGARVALVGRGRHRLRRGRAAHARHVGTRRRRSTPRPGAANGAWPTRPRCAAAWCAPSRRRRRGK